MAYPAIKPPKTDMEKKKMCLKKKLNNSAEKDKKYTIKNLHKQHEVFMIFKKFFGISIPTGKWFFGKEQAKKNINKLNKVK